MINNFVAVVSDTFDNLCANKYTIQSNRDNIVEVCFEKFSLRLYYCSYEFDLGLNYCKNNKEVDLNQVLKSIGCLNQLPTYKFMSNEEIMISYLEEYISLLNSRFEDLENFIPN